MVKRYSIQAVSTVQGGMLEVEVNNSGEWVKFEDFTEENKPTNKHIENVKEFHRKARQGISDKPIIPSEETRMLRAKLILEETVETINAMGITILVGIIDGGEMNKNLEGIMLVNYPNSHKYNLVEIADGCADLNVVVTGTQLECGIPIKEVQEAVDQSNLAKFTGDYSIREDGKVIKPSNWKEPDIKGILEKNGWDG